MFLVAYIFTFDFGGAWGRGSGKRDFPRGGSSPALGGALDTVGGQSFSPPISFRDDVKNLLFVTVVLHLVVRV